MGLDQVKRPLHSEENYQQNENANYWIGEDTKIKNQNYHMILQFHSRVFIWIKQKH